MVCKYFAWIYDNHRYFPTVLHCSMLHAYVRVVSNVICHLMLGVSSLVYEKTYVLEMYRGSQANVVQHASPHAL